MKFTVPNPPNRPRPRPGALLLIFLSVFALINLGVGSALSGAALFSPTAKPTPGHGAGQPDLEKQIQEAVEQADEVLAYHLYEVEIAEVKISADSRWAVARLLLVDPATRQVVPTEPGLALARRVNGTWEVYLQSDPEWANSLEQLPADLLSPSAVESWRIQLADHLEEIDVGPYTGYLLPWAGGLEKFLTRSISHGIGGSMHYAFDFAQPGYPSAMFAIHASKGGIVKYAVWTFPNGYDDGNCGNSNFLVLEHPETTPPTYTLYMHLAQDSIPEAFRTPGASVLQGQYIGMADDTGCSSGNHLHLQTHTNPSSYWGASVDILFGDVAINGGRPRMVNEALAYPQYGPEGQDLYLSGNTIPTDTSLPVGTITSPAMGSTLNGGTAVIAGTASDSGSGLSHYQLVAKYGGQWFDIGPVRTSPQFTATWDLCTSGVPDGPVSVALNLWDNEGNLAALRGLTHLIKNNACPQLPPTCSPGPNQVALYAESEFQGDCTILDAGAYPDAVSFGGVGGDRAASIQVGSDLVATLFSDPGYTGRSETLTRSDRDLAENAVGAGTLSSLRTQPATAAPLAPALALPPESAVFSANSSLDLSWRDFGGGSEYQVELSGPLSTVSPWLSGPSWSLGSLPAGAYAWRVKARNSNGVSGWTASRTFAVTSAPPGSTTPVTPPFQEDFENGSPGWAGDGLWHLVNDSGLAHGGSYSWWYGQDGSGTYATGSPNAGDLTTPPIQIPDTGYAVHFWYRYETENPALYWDQRWVQVSVNGGPFENVLQLSDDEPLVWLQSPALDLSAYAGQTVQVRLHFTTLDGLANGYGGWWIDDFSLVIETAPACADANEPNNTPAEAVALGYAQIIQGMICPAGDRDFFRITGLKGDRVVIDIDAQSAGSNLDPYLFLLDSDGSTVLASSDDELLGVLLDPHLGYVFPENGDYYLEVRAWDHPGAGGEDFFYSIRLDPDSTDPEITLTAPASDTFLPSDSITVTAAAMDSGSGISRVEFWWQSGNWLGEDWELLGVDRDGTDGWSIGFNTAAEPEGSGMALFAWVYDWAGNSAGSGAWQLGNDRTPPQTTLSPLAPAHQTTAVALAWQGVDSVSGIVSYDLQSDRDLEGWEDYLTGQSPGANTTWFIGEPGRIYSFRVRGTDQAGNLEAYPQTADTLTYIQACESPDPWEPDNLLSQAAPLAVGGGPQLHNLCTLGDADWITITAQAGTHYRIYARPTHPTTAVEIKLYSPDGNTLLAETAAGGFGQWATMTWEAPASAVYALHLNHLNPAVAGDAVTYEIYILDGYTKYMPQIQR
jgi:murein DD-endopeptidase MepM/ murein hydrolase activator NlpD